MERSNIKMSSVVHKHRYPDDCEGVSPYHGMGANWMFLGYLGRPSSLALPGSWSRRRKTDAPESPQDQEKGVNSATI